jgi:hypothetical protein
MLINSSVLFTTVNEMSEYLLRLIKEEGQQEEKTISPFII